jgi:hypothetical protein
MRDHQPTPSQPYEAPPTLPPATADTVVIYKGLSPFKMEIWTADEADGKVKRKRRWFRP